MLSFENSLRKSRTMTDDLIATLDVLSLALTLLQGGARLILRIRI
jgi:hypothetical protein